MPARPGRFRVRRRNLAIVALLYCVITLIVRALPPSNILELVIAVGSPYAPLVALLGLVLSALSRRLLMSIGALLILLVTVAVLLLRYYFGPPADIGQHADIRVLSSNLRKGQADASSFVGLATASADVVTVSELTPAAVQRFSNAGITEVFPYALLFPAPGASGIGLYSRFPLAEVPPKRHPQAAIAAARLRIPGIRFAPLVASVHITSPLASNANSFISWRSGITSIKATLADFAGPGATIVAGDFNSTNDMRQFRDLLTNGYRDAAEETGAVFAPTFPAQTWHPPLIRIDHVLTRNVTAASIKTVTMPGSDHRSLLAMVHVPVDRTASKAIAEMDGSSPAPRRSCNYSINERHRSDLSAPTCGALDLPWSDGSPMHLLAGVVVEQPRRMRMRLRGQAALVPRGCTDRCD